MIYCLAILLQHKILQENQLIYDAMVDMRPRPMTIPVGDSISFIHFQMNWSLKQVELESNQALAFSLVVAVSISAFFTIFRKTSSSVARPISVFKIPNIFSRFSRFSKNS